MLARHLTAGLAEAAIPLWQAAGELALKCLALIEAITHLDQGPELISTLPWSSQRDVSELELRIRLSQAWRVLKGWATPEIWTSLHPALALARSLQRHDALLRVIGGLIDNIMSQWRRAESLVWAQEMLDIAPATGNSALLIWSHTIACICCTWVGEFT